MNLSPASKSLFTILFILLAQNKMPLNNGTLLNGVLRPKLLNKPSAYCSFMSLDFLIPHAEHFDCIIHLLCNHGSNDNKKVFVFIYSL